MFSIGKGQGKQSYNADEMAARLMDDDTSLRESLAGHVLKDWKNLKMDGKVIPYSVEKAKEILVDPAYQEFYEFVMTEAQNAAMYRKEEISAAVEK